VSLSSVFQGFLSVLSPDLVLLVLNDRTAFLLFPRITGIHRGFPLRPDSNHLSLFSVENFIRMSLLPLFFVWLLRSDPPFQLVVRLTNPFSTEEHFFESKSFFPDSIVYSPSFSFRPPETCLSPHKRHRRAAKRRSPFFAPLQTLPGPFLCRACLGKFFPLLCALAT